MAFHPRYWSRGRRATAPASTTTPSGTRTGRQEAAQHIQTDTRPQPHAEEPLDLDPQIRLVPPPGGLIMFSGAQMHSTVPNTSGKTRFSIDFRLVHLDDVRERAGGPQRGLGLHGNDAAGLPPRRRPGADARRPRRDVRNARGGTAGGAPVVRHPPSGIGHPRLGTGQSRALDASRSSFDALKDLRALGPGTLLAL